MKKKHYQVLGISLFSSLLLASHQVLADEATVTSPSSHTSDLTANQTNTFTDHQALNQALSQASSEGIVVVADENVSYATKQAVENDYQAQTQTVNQVVKDYQVAKADYQKADQAYQDYQEALETYQKDSQAYQTYLAQEKQYQSDYEAYQNQIKAYDTAVLSNDQLEKGYQAALSQYHQDEAAYQEALANYQKEVDLNKEKEAQYQTDLANYEKALKDYETAKKEFDQVSAANDRLLSDYEQELKDYQQAHKEWELEKALYDEKLKAAEADTLKEGYLSQVHAQYLIFKNEPNAKVSFEGVQDFFGANHDFGETLAGIGGDPKDISKGQTPSLAKGVGGATAAGPGDGYGVFLKQGQPITVTYTGLEKSSYKGRAITKVVYTFELVSTFSPDQTATAFIYTDPTKTIYVGQNGDNPGTSDFTIHQTIRFYYNDKEEVVLEEDASSLLSLSSLNHSFEFGEQEYVKLSDQMTFIPITGSSVSSQDRIVASFGSNNSKADGSRYDRSDWDNDGHDNEYFGAGVAKIVGSTIAFDFGIRYSQEEIKKSSNPGQLRNSSRLWFAVNTDLKASGILDESLKDEPKAPEKPKLNTSVKEPTKPEKPQAPSLSTPKKPTAPSKPSKPNYQPLPKKPVAPKAPQKINKPEKPKAVAKPTLPDLPVIFYHKASLKPVVKTSTAKKAQATTTSSRAVKTTVYYLPALSSPITYQAYQTYSPTKTVGTQSSIKTSNPDKVGSQTKTRQSTSKKNETSSSQEGQKTKTNKSLFSKNTGLSDEVEKIFHQFTKDLEKKGKEKYAWAKFIPSLYQNLVDSYVFQGIAQGGSYQTARTQIPFVTFSSLPKSDNTSDAINSLSYQHGKLNDYPDLAHSGATLATSGITGVFSTLTKPFLGIVPSSSNILKGLSIANSQSNAKMLNSFYGDLITTMGTDDILANMDSIILSQHPDYRHLPAHERLKKYYSQTDLDQKRQELFLESYSKDKSTAKLKFVATLAFSSLTLGGILAMGYSIVTGQTNGSLLKENLNKLDDVVLGGSLKQFIKSPISSTVNYAKNVGRKVVTKVKTGWNSLTKKVSNFFGGKSNKKATKPKSSSKPKTKAKASGLLSKAGEVLKKPLKQAKKLVSTANKKLKENKTLNKISSTLSNLGKSKTTSKKKTASKKKAATKKKAAPNKKSAPKKKATPKKKAAPKKKATPKKKSAPKKKATPKKKVAPKKKVTSKKKKRR